MKHIMPVSRRVPSPAFYYQLTLMQKIMELGTILSFMDSAWGMIKGVIPRE